MCCHSKNKEEKYRVREINLNVLPSKERATFYNDRSIENFIVSGNYFTSSLMDNFITTKTDNYS